MNHLINNIVEQPEITKVRNKRKNLLYFKKMGKKN